MARTSRPSIIAAAALLALVMGACSGAAPGAGPTTGPGATAGATGSASSAGAPASAPAGSALAGGLTISGLLKGTVSAPATTWTRISDTTAPFTYEVPSSWTMHSTHPWTQGDATLGTSLAAGPDLTKLSTDFSVPAIVIGLSADAGGMTPRQALAGNDFSSACAPAEPQEASEPGGSAAYQLWRSCGGGAGSLLVMIIAPTGSPALIGIVFQATTDADLGYLDHIVGSIAPASAPAPSAAPASTGGSVSGETFTISMNLCQNQHGQGVAEGLIRNDDTLIHTYRIVVAYWDPNHVFLNDADWTTSDLQPGVTARWQVMVPSGLPAVSVSCEITAVELVR